VHRVLVIANKTLADENLLQRLAEYMAERPCRFYVLIPAGQLTHNGSAATDNGTRGAAAKRLYDTLRFLNEMGADASGEVSEQPPMAAVAELLSTQEFDEVLVATLPPGTSGWLAQDLPQRVAQAFGRPVEHFSARPAT
jgi:hypothetical protein